MAMTIETLKRPVLDTESEIAGAVVHLLDCGGGNEVILPVWDQAMDHKTQISVDRALDYMIRHGIRPRIQANGDILTIAAKIVQDMQAALPENMHGDLNVMLDHLLQWICDYAEHTHTKTMHIRFGFEGGHK